MHLCRWVCLGVKHSHDYKIYQANQRKRSRYVSSISFPLLRSVFLQVQSQNINRIIAEYQWQTTISMRDPILFSRDTPTKQFPTKQTNAKKYKMAACRNWWLMAVVVYGLGNCFVSTMTVASRCVWAESTSPKTDCLMIAPQSWTIIVSFYVWSGAALGRFVIVNCIKSMLIGDGATIVGMSM